jgi:hypothetical protein
MHDGGLAASGLVPTRGRPTLTRETQKRFQALRVAALVAQGQMHAQIVGRVSHDGAKQSVRRVGVRLGKPVAEKNHGVGSSDCPGRQVPEALEVLCFTLLRWTWRGDGEFIDVAVEHVKFSGLLHLNDVAAQVPNLLPVDAPVEFEEPATALSESGAKSSITFLRRIHWGRRFLFDGSSAVSR